MDGNAATADISTRARKLLRSAQSVHIREHISRERLRTTKSKIQTQKGRLSGDPVSPGSRPSGLLSCISYCAMGLVCPVGPVRRPLRRRMGRTALYRKLTSTVETMAFTNVVAVLHFASTSAICWGWPRMYIL